MQFNLFFVLCQNRTIHLIPGRIAQYGVMPKLTSEQSSFYIQKCVYFLKVQKIVTDLEKLKVGASFVGLR